jgi:hypothetical protein
VLDDIPRQRHKLMSTIGLGDEGIEYIHHSDEVKWGEGVLLAQSAGVANMSPQAAINKHLCAGRA